MPPFIPTRRRLSTTPPSTPPIKKPNLFDAADKPSASKTLQDNKRFLDKLNQSNDDSSLSDVSSRDFEDVMPSPKRRKITAKKEEENEDEIDWEDAIDHGPIVSSRASAGISGDLELTLDKNDHTIGSLTDPHSKKTGPSKIAREIRFATHRMHVQFLLFHNLMRNGWTTDREVQSILVGLLPQHLNKEIDKWRFDSGLSAGKESRPPKKATSEGQKGRKPEQNERNQRNWGKKAQRQERGVADLSAGDPIIRLLKILTAYWKKVFTITAPGLRKQGYKPLSTLEEEIACFRNDKHNPEEHGERIDGIAGFREAARIREGSRDVGAQLFTALLKGLNIDARLVASLQPVGFGWSKNEEASTKKKKGSKTPKNTEEEDSDEDISYEEVSAKKTSVSKLKAKISPKPIKPKRRTKGAKDAPIDLADDSEMDSLDSSDQDDDDESLIDVTLASTRRKPNMDYDKDMLVPNYWTEVISPITYNIYPVDALVLKTSVVTSSEYLCQFEPRGAKAERAKQVFAYIIAYSSDGTAKDVTTRYLKRHVWPGRTKGVRIPTEKMPVHNKKGKIVKHEEYDWFKTVMSGYERPHAKRAAVDDLEEEKHLKRAKLEKKDTIVREDTLQFYKTSAEFVLERHLRREEAVKPGSKPVRTFKSGKGDNAKEENVFRRKEIEACRTGESWHKEGRAVKPGEQAMKMVPIRAVTLTRKREVEEAERDTGEKQKQGLYAWNQTDWIIPPPIENGVIPKNAYGNIDCFVPTMVPRGAVHIPLRKTVMICKKLSIDYAEAVTGFEFGNKMAVPVITGVVIAKENEHTVIDQWEKNEKERQIKEEGKREKVALATWRRWLMGLRIIQRVREEYGGDADAHMKEEMNPFTNQGKAKKKKHAEAPPTGRKEAPVAIDDEEENAAAGFFIDEDEELGGGFLPEGYNEEGIPQQGSELTIEEPGKKTNGPHPVGLAALATNGYYNDIDSLASSDSEENAATSPPPPKSTSKGRPPKKIEGSPFQKPSANSNKRRAPSTPADAFDEELPAPMPNSPAPIPTRVPPKRSAARKSGSTLNSHYFDHGSEEEDEKEQEASSDHNPDPGSNDVVAQPPPKKRGRPTWSTKKGR